MIVRLRTVQKAFTSAFRLTLDLADEENQQARDCPLRIDKERTDEAAEGAS